jgi:hypothetical protein
MSLQRKDHDRFCRKEDRREYQKHRHRTTFGGGGRRRNRDRRRTECFGRAERAALHRVNLDGGICSIGHPMSFALFDAAQSGWCSPRKAVTSAANSV